QVAAVPVSAQIGRYRLDVVEAPLPINGFSSFASKRFAVYGDDKQGTAVVARLAAEGVDARLVRGDEATGVVDGFIDLSHLAPVEDPVRRLRELFERVKAAAMRGAKNIIIATGNGGA